MPTILQICFLLLNLCHMRQKPTSESQEVHFEILVQHYRIVLPSTSAVAQVK